MALLHLPIPTPQAGSSALLSATSVLSLPRYLRGYASATSSDFVDDPYSDAKSTASLHTGARRRASKELARVEQAQTPFKARCACAPSSCDRKPGRLLSQDDAAGRQNIRPANAVLCLEEASQRLEKSFIYFVIYLVISAFL